MSGSEDDDLPSLSEGVQDLLVYAPYQVNVDDVINERLKRKEKQKEFEALRDQSENLASTAVFTLPPPKPQKITAFPPTRTVLHADRSLTCFNAGIALPVDIIPHDTLATDPLKFFQSVKLTIETCEVESCRQILIYLWLLQSVHSDAQVVTYCNSLLLELNHLWTLKWQEVILVFRNWGASPQDIITSWKADEIDAVFEPSPLVSPYNVQCTLAVLSQQMIRGPLEGDKSSQKALFILLTLLSLDEAYSSCLSEIQCCLQCFEDDLHDESTTWVGDYCKALLEVEQDFSRLAYVAQTVLPEAVRACLALPLAQQLFSVEPITFLSYLEPSDLCNILKRNVDALLSLEFDVVYSFVILVDCAVLQFVTTETDKVVRSDLLLWLRDLSQKVLRVCVGDEVDLDATLVRELLGRLRTEWEESWNDLGDYTEQVICNPYDDSSSDESEDQENESKLVH